MRFENFSFGAIRIDGVTYETPTCTHDRWSSGGPAEAGQKVPLFRPWRCLPIL
jgi:hypothetical protein